MTADLNKRFPQDTFVQFDILPTLRALSALNQHDAPAALEELRKAEPYELSPPNSLIGALYPIYIRGLALIAAHRAPEAAHEFQRILDHPGIVGSDPVGVLARLQIGRAVASAGDRDRALAAYRELLDIWRDADPSISLLSSARLEARALERDLARKR